MVAAEIATGFSALKSAYEIARGLKDINDRVALNTAVIALQERILSAQEAASSARDEMRSMQSTIDAFTAWEATAARYQLKDFGGQTYAYELKDDASNGVPRHLVCPNCFQSRRLAILQLDGTYWGRKRFTFLSCDKHVDLGVMDVSATYQAASDYNPFGSRTVTLQAARIGRGSRAAALAFGAAARRDLENFGVD